MDNNNRNRTTKTPKMKTMEFIKALNDLTPAQREQLAKEVM